MTELDLATSFYMSARENLKTPDGYEYYWQLKLQEAEVIIDTIASQILDDDELY